MPGTEVLPISARHPARWLACLLLAGLFSSPASAVDCPVDVDVDYCTANDLQPTGSEIIAGPSSCTAGETIALTLRVKFEDGGGASSRYDVGFFIGDDGGPAVGGGSCTFASLSPLEPGPPPLNLTSGTGSFRNIDGDACGDIGKREPTYRDIQLNSVLCKDDDGDGQVDIAYTLTWDNNQNDDSCTDPDDPLQFAPQPPKCRADLGYDLPIKVEQPPTIEASKLALPAALREPGGEVLFRVGVANTSPSSTDPVTITSITDAPYGDISDATSCSLPFTLAPGERRECEFTRTITGTAGQVFPDTVTFSGNDDEGTPVSASAEANVLIISSGAPPQPGALELRKFALPGSLPEPGGKALYLVAVSNPGEQNVELQSMVDDLYGDLDGQGNCSLPQLLTPGGKAYLCGFIQDVNGPPGTLVTDIITATGTDSIGTMLESSDSATVEITDLGSAISVLKSPNPAVLPEPGGPVEFTVLVQNLSAVDRVDIDTLEDNLYDLGSGCAAGFSLAPGGDFYECSFSAEVLGNAGSFETNVVTAAGLDDDGQPVSAEGAATVRIIGAPPSLELRKIALPPLAQDGGTVTYLVAIRNTSSPTDPVTIDTLTDTIDGNTVSLDGAGSCTLPQTLQPQEIYTCTFSMTVNGNPGDQVIDTVTASGNDDDGQPASASDQATVTIIEIPPVTADLRVAKFAAPAELPEPGGEASFTVLLANVSTPGNVNLGVTVNSLVDVPYGNLDGQGDCALPVVLAPGEFYLCSFSQDITGEPGEVFPDTVTASGLDSLQRSVSASAGAEVIITDVPSAITVRKLAQPLFIDEPGANVTYYYAVINGSQVDSVDISSLVDDRLGDLAGQGDCSVPQSLAPGAVYTCSVTTFLAGDGGDIVVNNVVAAGLDDDGIEVEDDAQATVRVRDLPAGLVTVKSANPPSLLAPGGSVTFEFTSTNTSAVDVVTIESMIDSVFGDLDGRGDCQVPQQLQPGASYSCSFTEALDGAAGDSHVNQVLVSGLSEDDDPVSAQSSAIVRFLGLPVLPNAKPVPTIGQLAAAMLVMLMAGLGIRAMRRRRALGA